MKAHYGIAGRAVDSGFTRTDLVALILMLALLVAMLLPSLANTANRSQRSNCLTRLGRVGVATSLYAGENNDTLPTTRSVGSVFVQIALNPPIEAKRNLLGLWNTNESLWTCPNRPSLPIFEPQFPQWDIGYQYFGGVTNWTNPSGNFPARSPKKLTQSRPYWTLAADAVMKVNGAWGGLEPGREFVYADMPQHRGGDSIVPQGGNQLFADGSARWIKFEQMHFLTSWNTADRQAFFYQEPMDFDPRLAAALPNLSATRFR